MDLIENKNVDAIVCRHPWELARYRVIAKVVNGIINKHKEKKIAIIDIGCGDGFVIKNLSKSIIFETIIAVDANFSESQIKKLKLENNRINFYKDLSEICVESDLYYIILLNDVIEHVENHLEFLKCINEIIIKKTYDSCLYITVPAFNYLFSKHDVELGHFRRYEVSNLKDYNSILNLKLQDFGYFFFSLYLIRAIERKFNRNKIQSKKIGVSSWNHNKFVTKFVEKFLIFDFKIGCTLKNIKVSLPGLSAFIIFTKND